MRLLAAILALCCASTCWAGSPSEDAMAAELDRARAKIANQVQLKAYDLVDELVYGWTEAPIFASPTPVVLAGVTVPVGLGTGLQALVENHIAADLLDNPQTNVQLAHCPSCTEVVVQSGPEGTIISRGIDNPKVLEQLGDADGQHALFIDIEAEGTWLVLRARVTELSPNLPIVYSHTVSSSASTPALLRQSGHLKSADEARKEYINAINARGPVAIPLRIAVRTYAPSFDPASVAAPPFVWLQSGVELGANQGRAWTSSLIVGYSFVPQAYQGVMAQGRISRLISGRTRSLTHPDVYLFAGGAVMSVWGNATGPFQNEIFTADDLRVIEGTDPLVPIPSTPRSSFGGLHIGADLRLGNRIGFSTFLETLPSLGNSRNIGSYLFFAGIDFHSLGTEVTLWF